MTRRRESEPDSGSAGERAGGEPEEPAGGSVGAVERRRRLADAFAEALPEVTGDESDQAWGDRPGQRDDAWFRSQVPPHHG